VKNIRLIVSSVAAAAALTATGHATTLWRWTGRKFVPGQTKITHG
jgi:hypothetical protein